MVVPMVSGAIIPLVQVSECPISLIVPKTEPINKPLCPMQEVFLRTPYPLVATVRMMS